MVDESRLAEIRALAPELDDPSEIEIVAQIYYEDADNYEIAVSLGRDSRNWVQTHLRTIAASLHVRPKGKHLRPAITAELARRERARREKSA
jgi:hypothetical protein